MPEKNILVVDDEPELLKFTGTVLRKNGYTVFEASNPSRALEIFNREKGNIHMVLSDVLMPEQNGLQMMEELLAANPQLKVIFSSGYVDEESACIKKKGYRFLQKPYQITDLLKAVSEAMQ